MIILDATTKSIEVKLAGAVTANQLPVVASYVDVTTTAYTPGANDTQSNGATAVTAAAAPAASTQRQIKLLTVYNADTAAATVTVQLNNNATLRVLVAVTLAVGSTLVYTDGEGWRVLTSGGAMVASTLPSMTSQQLADLLTDETGSGGGFVRATSPTLVTPALGTPSAAVLTNATGLPTAGLLDAAVTYAKMQNVSATNRVLGRTTAGAGDVEEIALSANPGAAAAVLKTATDGTILLNGYAFPAVQVPSADVNMLDDYEEGTWTLTLTFDTPGNLSVAYGSERVGRYVKIGRVVHLFFSVVTITFTHTTASGNLLITGLPFAALTLAEFYPQGALSFQGITKTNYTHFTVFIISATSQLVIQASGSGQNVDNVVAADVPTGTTKVLRGQFTYIASS